MNQTSRQNSGKHAAKKAVTLILSLFGLAMLTAFPAGAAGKTAAKVPDDELKVGEYACYGSGGRLMIGLGFKVLSGGRYTDLDGKNAGRYTIKGKDVSFVGGHLEKTPGRDLKNGRFRVGSMASCEPF